MGDPVRLLGREKLDLRLMVSDETSGAFRPRDLARIGGVSVATVHFYERSGFLPPVPRRASGHRVYEARHAAAMATARHVIAGYGWQYALRVMRHVHAGELEAALELADARHAAIDRERREIRETVALLEALTREDKVSPVTGARPESMRIGEVAAWLGVTIPTLRFWEAEGLIAPQRDATSRYRVYAREDLDRLRVIATLRRAGYGVPHVREVMRELRRNNVDAALREVRGRLGRLSGASRAAMRATAALDAYIRDWAEASTGAGESP